MGHYTQMTLKERRRIGAFLEMGFSIKAIAERLCRHRSTIYRELDRNEEGGYYLPYAAHGKSQKRKHRKPLKLKVGTNVYKYVMEKLKLGWSPEQISGRMKRIGLAVCVCHETIYQYVYRHASAHIYYYLPTQRNKRRSHRKRQKQSIYNGRRSITMRPIEAENREKVGHWEGDTIRFVAERKQSITTLVERKSRFLVLKKNIRSTSDIVMNHIRSAILEFPKRFWGTVTFDQGSEFSNYTCVERDTGCKVFYAYAHSPWQRGTNENTNKRLRRYLPKKGIIKNVEQEALDRLADHLNDMPRKCLGYLTPKEVLFSPKKRIVALDSRA